MEDNLGNWDVVADALADVTIEHQLPLQPLLTGMHAFLMALNASGHADPNEIADELSRMADYYRSLVWKN
jgi:hypothetical protein